jgi:hypothetical protein
MTTARFVVFPRVLMLQHSPLVVVGVGMRMGLHGAVGLGSPPSLPGLVLPVRVLRRSIAFDYGSGSLWLGFPPSLVGLVLPVILAGFVFPVVLRQGSSRAAEDSEESSGEVHRCGIQKDVLTLNHGADAFLLSTFPAAC